VCYFLGPLFAGLLVVMSVVVVLVLLLISFPVDDVGLGRGVPVQLFFVVCYCFLFWIGCVSFLFCSYEIGSFMFCLNSLLLRI